MAGKEAEGSLESKFVPFSVDEGLIARAKSGEEDAFTELDAAVRGKLTGYFFLRLPEEADDLAQIAVTKITTGLGRFIPHSEKPVPEQFTYWSFRIARNVLNTELREVMKRKAVFVPHSLEGREWSTDAMLSRLHVLYARPGDVESDEDAEFLSPEERLDMWIEANVTERQYYIYEQKNLGRENRDIAKDLKLTSNYIGEEVSEIRQKLEGELLVPSGFQQAISFRDDAVDGLSKTDLNDSLKKGRLPAIKILGRYYTTSEGIEAYLEQRRKHRQADTAVEGYVLLSEHVSQNDHSNFLRNPGLRVQLVFDNDRAYVRPDDLERYRESRERKAKTPRIEVDAPEGYSRLHDLSATKAEYSRYRGAALAGSLPTVRLGKTIFVKPEDIEIYKEKYDGK